MQKKIRISFILSCILILISCTKPNFGGPETKTNDFLEGSGDSRPDNYISPFGKLLSNEFDANLSIGIREEILERGYSWVAENVPYSTSWDSKDLKDGYRRDCSGFISFAWQIEKSIYGGANTSTIIQFATVIELNELLPGDALVNSDPNKYGHAILFVEWIDLEFGTFIGLLFSSYAIGIGHPQYLWRDIPQSFNL